MDRCCNAHARLTVLLAEDLPRWVFGCGRGLVIDCCCVVMLYCGGAVLGIALG